MSTALHPDSALAGCPHAGKNADLIRKGLTGLEFDSKAWRGREQLQLMVDLFDDLGVMDAFNIGEKSLQTFLAQVRGAHSRKDCHNWTHAMRAVHSIYWFMTTGGGMCHVKQVELLAMLITALTYCIRHPGQNDDILLESPEDFPALQEATPRLLNHTRLQFKELRHRIEKNSASNILVATRPKEVEAFYAAAEKCYMATLVPRFSKLIPNLVKAPYCLPTSTHSNRPAPIENTISGLKVAKAQPLLKRDGSFHYNLPRVIKPSDEPSLPVNIPTWITQGGGLTSRTNASVNPATLNPPMSRSNSSISPMHGSPSRGAAKKRPGTSTGDALSKLTRHLYTERRLAFPEATLVGGGACVRVLTSHTR